MPFDGIVTKAVSDEINLKCLNSRIEKIFMPERDEVVLAIRTLKENLRISLNVNPSVPRVNITEIKKSNPDIPPMFCMVLRKHLTGGKIIKVQSIDFERVLEIYIETLSELGDIGVKRLIVEIMGKHSNIVLVNENNIIIDSLKHIDSSISSKREVMPARHYELPPSQQKVSPDEVDIKFIFDLFTNTDKKAAKLILERIQGFSPQLAAECCYNAGIDEKELISNLSDVQVKILALEVNKIIDKIKGRDWDPSIYSNKIKSGFSDFYCFNVNSFGQINARKSICVAIDDFFKQTNFDEKLNRAKSNLIKTINTNIERCVRKQSIQQKSIENASDLETDKKYGDLIMANIYRIKEGDKVAVVEDFYLPEMAPIEIPLQINLSPQMNAQKFYKIYNKKKNTIAKATIQLSETQSELEYLESVHQNIEQCDNLGDLAAIREELVSSGYFVDKRKKVYKKQVIKKGKKKIVKKVLVKEETNIGMPHAYKSTDGFSIYAGKNNKMNDLLTLKSSRGDDIWLHTQKIPGSHVIIKSAGANVPTSTLEQAAMISAFHSRAKLSSNIPVDYTQVKNVKKPQGAKPGMVIYDNFKTIFVTPNENEIKKLIID